MPATHASHQRRLRAFDPAGDLPERSAALWNLVQSHERAIARKFWERYREHSAGGKTFDDAKLEQLAERASVARTIHELNMVEVDVFVAHAIHYQQQEHDGERNAKAEEFNRRVV